MIQPPHSSERAQLSDERIIEAGYMHTVDDDEPLFAFDRQELISMVRELIAADRATAPVSVVEPVAWRMFDGEGGYNYREEAPTEQDIEWIGRYGRKYEPLYATHNTATRAQAPDSAA
jgi:hypothetical protein